MVESEQHSGRIVPVVAAITFLGFLDTHLLIPIIALYASGLGASTGVVGLIVGLYSMVNTPANILFGRLIDRVGHRAPLRAGLMGNALSMILYAFTRNPLQLALVRALHGLTGALVAPSTMSLVAHHSVGHRRGRSMSFYGMAVACASLVGYPISGVIAARLGYSAVFFLAAVALGSALLLSLTLPRHIPAAATAVSGGRTLARIRSLFTRRALVPAYASIFAQYFTFGAVVTLLPLHVEALNMGPLEVGLLLAAFSVLFVITQLPGGAISDRMGRRIPTVAGLACVIIALTALPSLLSFAPLVAVMAVYGLGYGLVFPSISALIADHTGTDERGLASGLFHALLTAGVAIGAPLMGWVGSRAGTDIALILTPIPALLALLLVLLYARGK